MSNRKKRKNERKDNRASLDNKADKNNNTQSEQSDKSQRQELKGEKFKVCHSPLKFNININKSTRELSSLSLWIIIVFSVLGFSAFLFCVYTWIWGLPCKILEKEQITTDESVIVGILSLLVTLLVAWNIWQTIISRQQVKELQSEIENRTQITLNINLYHAFFLHGKNEQNRNHPENALNYYVHSLECAIKGKIDVININAIISKIENLITSYNWIRINPKDAEYYSVILESYNCRKKDDIIKFIDTHKDAKALPTEDFGTATNLNEQSIKLISDKEKEIIDGHTGKIVCPVCGRRGIIYSRIPYQLPYKKDDYKNGDFLHLIPGKCLYGECMYCGLVILRSLDRILDNREDKTA